MKKLISLILITILHLTFVIGPLSLADVYRLAPYDTIELEIVNHPELKTKQTVTPDGLASLPMIGIVSIEGQTLTGLQKYLTDGYSAYIANPQIIINLTPRPIYVVQYDLKKDTWEVKTAKSVDEAKAFAGLDPKLSIEHGDIYKVSMGTRPDFWDNNWYKVITATAVLVGIYSTVRK